MTPKVHVFVDYMAEVFIATIWLRTKSKQQRVSHFRPLLGNK
nr:hypothetical protein 220p1_00142 [Serratia entomophila]